MAGKRDRAILALLIGCGLRRAELLRLNMEDLQQREARWVLRDLIGKGTGFEPSPFLLCQGPHRSLDDGHGHHGRQISRPVIRAGPVKVTGILDERVNWRLVVCYARKPNSIISRLHDLRSTCAKLVGGPVRI